MGLHSSAGRALQRERRGHGFESRWSPPPPPPTKKKNFFSGFTSHLLKLRFNCDGHIFISFQYNFCIQVWDEINWLIDWWMNGWMDGLIDWLIDRFLFPTTVLGHWKGIFVEEARLGVNSEKRHRVETATWRKWNSDEQVTTVKSPQWREWYIY